MNLHEYQAKQLFAEYGLPVAPSLTVDSAAAAAAATGRLGGSRWAVKVQVHAGGRGKAGGVKIVKDAVVARQFAEHWLGRRLVTAQTGGNGQPVQRILVERCVDITSEFYLGAVIDRSSQRIVFMASTEGGVDIEQLAQQTPEKILRARTDPLTGAQAFQGRELAFALGLEAGQANDFAGVFLSLARLFQELDLSLVEVNPLVLTRQGELSCLDAKINVDGNALYRQAKLRELHDPSQDDEREALAARWQLSYVALDGNIGCMVNGAGLAMATMDIVQLHGGSPANFLDVGGSATAERVAEAFKIILAEQGVRAVLVNIFGGIVRCDLIAEGIIEAVREVGVSVPVVVRLEGNNADKGRGKLAASGLDIFAADSLQDAASKVVAVAGEAP